MSNMHYVLGNTECIIIITSDNPNVASDVSLNNPWVTIDLQSIEKKVKSSMARSLPVENLLPQKWGQLSTTFSNH